MVSSTIGSAPAFDAGGWWFKSILISHLHEKHMKRVDEAKAKKVVLLSKRYDMLNKVFNESMVKAQEIIYIFGESTVESDNWPLAKN